ncbi:hypothetical protein K8352_14535 [Flavobacteriaceae bacterium F89]|uniref:Uncharacterized protein n=1 Tax=Cerina litoralis TaxID=2874477 RepID=A0AAE3EX91_9FLAO|nr:hypothetical protein [Cerina litoralis]
MKRRENVAYPALASRLSAEPKQRPDTIHTQSLGKIWDKAIKFVIIKSF